MNIIQSWQKPVRGTPIPRPLNLDCVFFFIIKDDPDNKIHFVHSIIYDLEPGEIYFDNMFHVAKENNIGHYCIVEFPMYCFDWKPFSRNDSLPVPESDYQIMWTRVGRTLSLYTKNVGRPRPQSGWQSVRDVMAPYFDWTPGFFTAQQSQGFYFYDLFTLPSL
jgi:hypothetical protein